MQDAKAHNTDGELVVTGTNRLNKALNSDPPIFCYGGYLTSGPAPLLCC